MCGDSSDTALAHLQFFSINLEEDSGRVLLGVLRVHRGYLLATMAPGGHEVDDHLRGAGTVKETG